MLWIRWPVVPLAALFCVLPPSPVVSQEQTAEQERSAILAVAQPAYPPEGGYHPSVVFDEGHNNEHTASGSGSYAGFFELLRNDGYRTSINAGQLDAQILADILILPTPQAFPADDVNRRAEAITHETWTRQALTQQELDSVEEFVEEGGALLLITGHAPRAFWSQAMAARFGVDVNNSYAYDVQNSHRTEDTDPPGAWILFSRENGMLRDHPITLGDGEGQAVNRITANGAASIVGPPSSTAFLSLGDSATEWVATDFAFWSNARGYHASAAGRAQGIALRYGQGRVVVLTPTAPFRYSYMTRQDELGESRQLALNVVRWLSGWLD